MFSAAIVNLKKTRQNKKTNKQTKPTKQKSHNQKASSKSISKGSTSCYCKCKKNTEIVFMVVFLRNSRLRLID